MRNLKKPIVRVKHASLFATMLALASDFRLVSDRARVAFLFVKVGLSGANMGALHLLPPR